MVTLFTVPKPFRGHAGVIQRNAIKSWTMLRPPCEILLLGDDDGTGDMAEECGVHHVPDIARNEFGTPFLDSAFAAAECCATNDVLCYVNADILLVSDFMAAVTQLADRKRRFLMIGQRWDVDIHRLWDFDQSDWEEQLRSHVRNHGTLHPPAGSDYFVFRRGLWKTLPPFAVGRTRWDNWLIFRARALGVPVIDATGCVMAVHQNHDYTYAHEGEAGSGYARVWKGPEAQRNLALAGGGDHICTLNDATHILTPRGIEARFGVSARFRRYLRMFPIMAPQLRGLWGSWRDPS